MKQPLLLFFFLFSFGTYAQSVVVRDKSSLQLIENVEIRSDLPQAASIRFSDRSGKADLSAFASTDKLVFRRVGYQTVAYTLDQLRSMNFTVAMAEKQLELNEVVVAANRSAEPRSHVAQPIRVFTRNELRFLNQPTMAEVLQQSGQVLVQKSQLGGGSPILRGFEANKVLIVVDGVRMNNAIFRGGHLQNILTIDNAVVERMEVALGPGSVVYGSDALGGVIYVQTLSPKLSASGATTVNANGFVRYSSAMNEKTAHADWTVGFRKWALTTSLTASDFGDLRQGRQRNADIGQLGLRPFYAGFENNTDVQIRNPDPSVQVSSGYKQIDLLQKVLFQPNDRTQHLLNIQFSTTNDIPRYDRLTEVDAKGNLSHAQWYYGPQKRLLTSYGLTKQFTAGVADELRVIAAYQSIEESRHNRRFGNYGLQNRTEQVGVWTLNADLKKKLAENHTLRYGLEATYNDVQSTAYRENRQTGKVDPLDTRYPDGGANTQSLAGYLSGTVDVSTRSTLTYGGRYAWNRLYATFNDKTFFPFPYNDITQQSGALTGSLGWLTRLPGSWQLAASLSSGYRVPNVDDLAKVFESVAGTLVVPNPTLKPERTYTLDAGIRKQLAERVSLEVEGFYTVYKNAITTQPVTLNGQTQIDYNGRSSRIVTQKNSQQARLYGFNAQLSADLTQALTLFGTVTYTRGRILTDTTGYPLDHIPPIYGKGGLRLTITKFRAEANVLFNGWKRLKDYNLVGEDNIVYATPNGMPSWQTINLRASYQLNRHVQMQAALENILDRSYRVFASGISAPGRNLVLTLRGTL
ncbi:TonB-dependent receptor plug domain-containing protein [Spirosoma utsteinense]|uniref:Hemoglobin/transferrin/lactoferrin receptor protein n=1 Tax=Spirosoma utsteinense TaxID=2585773 RepID=A0ABR6W525_9BACT|nr:TonB-dependent receptor [Spirosoma utsteinense]MBC3786659.1 hemoglobin/transferrin/lactoferrin receptor protein [Spirosoma utsteinense]MBC3791022.1 hemoglobin/transferrin/lactoferrin receptor protein [Spirosoma utsteinense]